MIIGRQKSASNGGEQEGQGYLISVSDLMAGLLFVFIITLMIFALKLSGTEANLNSELEDTQNKKRNLENIVENLTDAKKIRSSLLNQIQDSLRKAGFTTVRVNLEHGILHLPEDLLFPSGSASLQPDGKQMLKVLADVSSRILPCYTGTLDSPRPLGCSERWFPGRVEAIFLEGHTDDVPVGRQCQFKDNWDLSTCRAIETFKYLVECNSELEKLINQNGQRIFSVSGYADRRPVAPNDIEANRHRNRRIDFRFIMTPPKSTPEVVRAISEELQDVPN